MAEVVGGPSSAGTSESEEHRLVTNAKKIALVLMGIGYQKFLAELEKQQEVLAGISDVIMEMFAMESALLRCEKNPTEAKSDMTAVLLRDAMARIEVSARNVVAACSEGDTLRTNMAVLRRFAKYDPIDAIATRRRIAQRLLDTGRYVV